MRSASGDLWGSLALGQTALLLVVWTHACIGLHFWLRLSRFYRCASPFLLAAAVLIPALSLAGFVVAGRDAVARAAEAAAAGPTPDASAALPLSPTDQFLAELETSLIATGIVLVVLAITYFALRSLWRRRHGGVRVGYTAGPTLRAPRGPTLLEISRTFGVPHVSICGGSAPTLPSGLPASSAPTST